MGVYFSWGNVEGHPEGSGYDFTQEAYDATPGGAISTDLSLEQDAARVNLGAPWRMPSMAEFQELLDNCTSVWTTLNGIYGRLFTSNINGHTLFIPAAGYIVGTSIRDRGGFGLCWTTKYSDATNASDFAFDQSSVYTHNTNKRYFGIPVRAVMDPT